MNCIFKMLNFWIIKEADFVFNFCQHLLKVTLQAVLQNTV